MEMQVPGSCEKGYLPQAILNYIALLGWSPETEQEIYTLEELIKVLISNVSVNHQQSLTLIN